MGKRPDMHEMPKNKANTRQKMNIKTQQKKMDGLYFSWKQLERFSKKWPKSDAENVLNGVAFSVMFAYNEVKEEKHEQNSKNMNFFTGCFL